MKPLRIALLASYASLGPITGPLVAGVVRSAKRREWVLCGLYVAAIPCAYVLLGAAAASML